MKAFLKENSVLVAGIALPLLLTIIFFALTQVQAINKTPPEHKLLFTSGNNYNSTYQIFVKDETAYLSFVPPLQTNRHPSYNKPRLYLFDPSTGESAEVTLPEISDQKEKSELIIDDLKTYKISTKALSPDGYKFTYLRRHSGNLMTEIFGGGYRSRSTYVLEKDNATVQVPEATRYNAQFIGWIL